MKTIKKYITSNRFPKEFELEIFNGCHSIWKFNVEVIRTALSDVLLIKPDVYEDNRGFFFESHHQDKYKKFGIPHLFVQDNVSFSTKGVLRGLHFQLEFPQDKLIYVISGEIFDVVVDIRKDSPTFGQWLGHFINASNHWQLFIPKGFAHGFCVLSEEVNFVYKCTDYYHPESEYGIAWNDPALKIDWPVANPIISEKDAKFKSLNEFDPHCLPFFQILDSISTCESF